MPKKKTEAPDPAARRKVAEKKLEGIKDKINARLEKAAVQENKADDHRLAAAIHLEEARQACKGTPIKFRDWVDKNVSQSYETVKTLVRIGAAENPKLALEDLRNKSAKANREARARAKKKKPPTVSREPAAPSSSEEAAPVGGDIPVHTLLDQVKTAFDGLGARDKLQLIAYAAADTGVVATFEGHALKEKRS